MQHARAHIEIDPVQLKLSKVLESIRKIGYQAYPYDPDKTATTVAVRA